MKKLITLLCFTSIAFSFAQDIELELLASGFNNPVSIKHAGDDRLFVVEQDGLIRIITAEGTIQSTPFLDINDRVIDTGNERGLLGLAFHPNYSVNGHFFVNYINNAGNTVISRFTMDFPNPAAADPNTELIILTYNQPYSNHNGGDLAFGPDGYLYISSGDGGAGGDPNDYGQNLGSLLGKLLRIDVNNSTVSNPYDIPADNPFVGNSTALDEIWSYGLRNPWRFSFDRSTGDLWIADVGQNNIEEINFTPSTDTGGLNYGWRCYEGTNPYNTTGCQPFSSYTAPVGEYNHSLGGCSITGGYRYRGSTYPNFQGLYFFADVCSQEIGYLEFVNGSWNLTFENGFSGSWVTFGETVDGELLISSIGGSIYRVTDSLLSVDENQLDSVSIFPNPADNIINIDLSNTNVATLSEISIFNTQGKVVKSTFSNENSVVSINISELNSGFYILKMNSEDGKQLTKKLVVQ